MARTNIVAQTLVGGYPSLPVGAGTADLTWTPADTSLQNDTAIVPGKTMILAYNSGAAPHTVTVTSAPDAINRKGDIGPYTVGAGDVSRFGPFPSLGWANGSRLQFEGNHAEILFAIITLP
jgi:hypothetical protein